MSINFNTSPYFDDYDEEKKFQKILYRPGYAVQTRELNQMQSMYQKQLDRFGQGIYKEGAMVIPGGISLNKTTGYVKLIADVTSVDVISGTETTGVLSSAEVENAAKEMVGKRAVGGTSGVEGIVKYYQLQTQDTPLTLFIEYDTSDTEEGDTESTQVFAESEVLEITTDETDENNYEAYRVTTASTEATGSSSLAEIERGVYFVNGFFTLVEKQTIVLNAYDNEPSYRVGLKIVESIVTPEQDSSLNDNANGSFNFAAPGAHRYKTELVLTKLPLGSTIDDDFVELLQTDEGERVIHVERTEYSELAKELARRTYDESGDYTVRPFRMFAKESRDNNRGQWVAGAPYRLGDIVTNAAGTYYVAVGYDSESSINSGNQQPSHVLSEVSDGNVKWAYEETPSFNNGQSLTGSEDEVVIAADSGKAYVRGYEIEKPSTTFIPIQKAREFRQVDDDLIPTTIGSYVQVRNITGIADFVTFAQVNLKDSSDTEIGTARMRGLEAVGNGNYRMYLFDISLPEDKGFDRNVKFIDNNDFDCEVANVVQSDAQGNVSVSGTTVTGQGTRFERDFRDGDIIDVGGNYYVVDGDPTSDTSLEITANGVTATSVAYKVHRSVLSNPARSISLFPLGRSYVRNVKNDPADERDMSYTVMQKVDNKTSSSTGTLSVSLSEVTNLTGVASRIDPNVEAIEIIVATNSGSFVTNFNYTVINDNEIQFSGLANNTTYSIFFPAIKNTPSTVSPKTKTPVRFATIEITDQETAESRVVSLQKADAYRVRKVFMGTAFDTPVDEANATDITDFFDLDDGQRDTHYGVSRLIRKPNTAVPTGTLKVYFDYFQHGQGDYFSIDSYADINREDIPQYSSIFGIVPLADALDFRPRLADDESGFTGTGSLALPPKPGTTTEVDYTYYIPRIDKISMDIEGKFLVTEGIASDAATAPETPNLSMHLATLTVAPYTTNPQFINIEKIDNRRYTMRDIGKIEKRVENLEYYTSLSLLEQQASSLNVPDEFGIDRFKNGFIVDNFAGHTTGDVVSPDYRASIDMEMQELRPSFSMDNAKLIEQARTDGERANQGYQLTGDLITLPYNEKELVSQTYASRPENVNPFAIFTFIGSVELNPPSDEWIETQRVPEIINDVEGNFSSVLAAETATGALGTVWNGWQTQWTGTQVTGTKMVRAADWSREDFGLGAGRWMNRNTFTAQERALIGNRAGGRVLTYEVIGNVSGQSRRGINTEVRATFSKELVNDRVVSTSAIPFIRSRKVAFLARGLKLQTIVYPFFDQVNISDYITPASRLTFTGTDTANPENMDLFDFETNVGQDNDEPARRFEDNVQTSYNKGDVIWVRQRGSVTYNTPEESPATAVCILQEVQPGGTSRSVLIVNIRGTFSINDRIRGTISDSEGIVSAFDLKNQGDRLVTNFGGDVAGVFDIPSTDALRFPTGTREFKLIDNVQNSDLIAKTRGFGDYHAEGVLQTWQATYNSVRNGEVVRTVVTDERTIVTDERAGRLVRDTGWYDPLAQTFLVQNRGGAFITSVDIWFASVDPVKPVTMQIREVVNGYPGKVILPFSNVTLYPYELRDENQPPGYGLSNNTITLSESGIVVDQNPQEVSISVIDESVINSAPSTSAGVIENDWNVFRNNFPNRQFWLLQPGTNPDNLFVPDSYISDPNANGPIQVNRDNGGTNVSDWFEICNLGSLNPGAVVSISIDNSGSMRLNTVESSYSLFKQRCSNAGLILVEREMRPTIERWAPPHNVDLSQFSTTDRVASSTSAAVWLAPDKPTKFYMKSPVFVQDVGEYCIVLLSNSNNYNVWTSELGGIDVTSPTPRLISEQPYAGVLFKSQNASTWTAHQNEDLMFRLNVAEFTQNSGSATFVNKRLDNIGLETNPFLMRNNSKLIRVYQRNHSLNPGDRVKISGVTTGTYNNISSAQLNATHDVLSAEHDSYVIRVSSVATGTGRTGGSGIRATKNIKFDTLQPIVQLQSFSDTQIDFSVKATTATSVTGAQAPGVLDSAFVPVVGNDNNEFNRPRMIASVENESKYLSGGKSFYLKANMSTSNTSLSPVIDTSRVSLIAVNNRINNATYSNYNYVGASGDGDLDVYRIVTSNDEVSFSGSTISTTADVVKGAFKQIRLGKYIMVTGSNLNNRDFLVTGVAEDGSSITVAESLETESAGAEVSIKLYDNFIDEIALEGSASAKYLTRKINLSGSAADSRNLSIKFAADIPVGSLVDVYYKTAQNGSSTPFNEVLWTKTGTATSNGRMTDLSFDVEGLPKFNTAAVKLVMRTGNSALVPRIKDLIIIATA